MNLTLDLLNVRCRDEAYAMRHTDYAYFLPDKFSSLNIILY